jgi:hypothetical protein
VFSGYQKVVQGEALQERWCIAGEVLLAFLRRMYMAGLAFKPELPMDDGIALAHRVPERLSLNHREDCDGADA